VIVTITNHPGSEVTKIERLAEKTIFHLVNGQALRLGMSPEKLQAMLNRIPEIPGIDLSQPPDTQREIFYTPFMERPIWHVIWPLVRTHRKIQKAFRGHPTLEAIARLGYDELRQLPLEAYVSGPFGLYLHHPINFVCRDADPTLPDGVNEYRGHFREADYHVWVYINVRTQSVNVEREHIT
jgi:hypothetical protein